MGLAVLAGLVALFSLTAIPRYARASVRASHTRRFGYRLRLRFLFLARSGMGLVVLYGKSCDWIIEVEYGWDWLLGLAWKHCFHSRAIPRFARALR